MSWHLVERILAWLLFWSTAAVFVAVAVGAMLAEIREAREEEL